MRNVVIREFHLKDINMILEIEKASFKKPYDFSTFIYLWRREPKGFLVAEVNNEVIGYIIVFSSVDKVGKIVSVAVKPEFRREGIGRKLMKEAMKHLIDKGMICAELEVRESNLGAIRFYEKLGFKKSRIVHGYYPNGENAVKMVKNLQIEANNDHVT